MKIALCSDLHLEFETITLENRDNADVLVLSGDICTAKDLQTWDFHPKGKAVLKFFENVSKEFPHVVYVLGNHEHYNYDYADSYNTIKRELEQFSNIHVLEKETFTLNDVTFVGGTLWTDMNKGDEMTLFHVGVMMNDFRIIKNGHNKVSYKSPIYKMDEQDEPILDANGEWQILKYEFKERSATLSTEDVALDHKLMLQYIDMVTKDVTKKFVVCGHHAPSKLSTKPRYQDDYLMNGGYSSDLSEFILDRPQIKMWTHGHTHDTFDYMVGSTRVVCNPRGYKNYEQRADEFELITFEV